MIQNKKILSVIPARGGSKGVPLKNLRPVLGTPLVTLAAQVSAQIDVIDKTVVSTDHDGIAEAAVKGGAQAPFRRPPHLSGDRISDLMVLTHAVEEMEARDKTRYDIIVMLQPTSPMRKAVHVEETIKMLVNQGLDAVWTVSETESKSHPLKQLVITNGRMAYYDARGADIIARQQLQPVYHRNGIAYAITRECLMVQQSIKGKNAGALEIKGHHVSIDTEWDFKLVELALEQTE